MIRPIENIGLGRNVNDEMAKGGPRLQEEIQKFGPNTIKMIALQQIADQEKQRAAQGNLAAQVNPATVVQQLEQELQGIGGLPQNTGAPSARDRVPQVGGVLAQKQQQQQKNMQQMAQRGGQPRPQGGQPQQPVMARYGGLMTQSAPNFERMYEGGIVAFANGGGVTEEELAKLGLSYERWEELSNEEQLQLVDRLNEERTSQPRSFLPGRHRKEPMDRQEGWEQLDKAFGREAEERDMGGLGVQAPGAKPPTPPDPMTTFTEEMEEEFDPTQPLKRPTPMARPKTGIASTLKEEEEDTAVTSPKGQIAQGTVGKAVLPSPAGGQPPSTELANLRTGIAGLRDKDAPARDAGEGHYRAGRALSEGIQGELDAVTRKATQRDTQFDEDSAKNKVRTLRETLSSAGGTGNFGVTGKAMSQALSSRQDALQDRGDELFKARQESIDKQVARSDEIAAGALVYGQEEANQARTDIRTALDASVQLHNMQRTDEREARRIEADIVLANAGNEVQVAVTNANNAVQSEANRIRDEYGIASLETADTTALLGYAEALAKVKVDAEITIGQVLAELTATIAAVTPPDEIDSDDDVAVKEWRAKTVGAATDRFAETIADLDARIKNVDKRIDAQDTQLKST